MKGKSAFSVEGGRRLTGEIIPQGAKNEALQVICASLLTDDEIIIDNIPEITDVLKMIELMTNLGVDVKKISKGKYSFRARAIDESYFKTEDYINKCSSIRGSLTLIGPMLSRLGRIRFPTPGGDKIGRRRLDTHISGLERLGAEVLFNSKEGTYIATAESLQGSSILLEEPSVTGTANIIMAAVLAEGKTTLYNAACEPYIQQLCMLLKRMGAVIEGEGTNRIIIEGVKSLNGSTHCVLPDMIEIGSFIGLAALTGSDLTIRKCRPDMLGIIPGTFNKIGVQLEIGKEDIRIPGRQQYEIKKFFDGSILTISDGPWPMFTPDLISIILVTAVQAKGTVLIHQKMFESRLFFVDKLIDMGAQIILCDPHRATIIGLDNKHRLKGIKMSSPDIRAGVALLIAAMSAEGKSTIYNIEQIDRGYENIDQRLNRIGAEIERIYE